MKKYLHGKNAIKAGRTTKAGRMKKSTRKYDRITKMLFSFPKRSLAATAMFFGRYE